jgi:hypothetical protein
VFGESSASDQKYVPVVPVGTSSDGVEVRIVNDIEDDNVTVMGVDVVGAQKRFANRASGDTFDTRVVDRTTYLFSNEARYVCGLDSAVRVRPDFRISEEFAADEVVATRSEAVVRGMCRCDGRRVGVHGVVSGGDFDADVPAKRRIYLLIDDRSVGGFDDAPDSGGRLLGGGVA